MQKYLVFVFLICVAEISCRHHEDYKPTSRGNDFPIRQPNKPPLKGYPSYPRYARDVYGVTDPQALIENSNYLREKRQVFGNVEHGSNGGTRGTLGASGNLLNQNGHSLDGHGQVSRNFNPNGPVVLGGGLNYAAPRGGASLDVNHARHMGTNLNAAGHVNLYQSPNRRTNLDGHANYNQNFGPNRHRDYGAGLTLTHKF